MQSNRRTVLQIGLGSTAAALLGIAAWQTTPFPPGSSVPSADAKPRSKQPQTDGGNEKSSGQARRARQETAHQHAGRGRDVRAGKWLVKGKEIGEENGKLFVHNLLPFEAFDSEEELAKRVEQGAKDNLFKLPLAAATGSTTTATTETAESAPVTEPESGSRNAKRKGRNTATDDTSTTEPESAPRNPKRKGKNTK